jgi:NDP-sugar pyrophosphorylase family protein
MKKKIVTAIVFADRRGEELLPLTETMCVALLPIVTKPLIEHTLESLSIARIHQAILIISATDAPRMKAVLGTGERFGLEIEYVINQGQENPATLLTCLDERLGESEYLLVRGDILHSLKINEFLEQSEHLAKTVHHVAMIEDRFAGICLWHRSVSPGSWRGSEILYWEYLQQNLPFPDDFSALSHSMIMTGYLSFIESLPSYYQANFDVLANRCSALTLPGYRIKEQLLVGHRSSQVPSETIGIIGHRCHVHSQARLNNVIIGDGVIIDKQVELTNVIVFSYTYVGKSLKLRNAIIWGNGYLQLEPESISLQVTHDLSLADLTKHSLKAVFTKGIKGLLARLPWKK